MLLISMHWFSGCHSWGFSGSLRSTSIRDFSTRVLQLHPQLHSTKWRDQTFFFLSCITGSVQSFTSKYNRASIRQQLGSPSPKTFFPQNHLNLSLGCCFPSRVSRPENLLVFCWVPDIPAACWLPLIEAKQGPGSKTETFPLWVCIPYQNLTSVYSRN